MKHIIMSEDLEDTLENKEDFGVTVVGKNGYQYFHFSNDLEPPKDVLDKVLNSWIEIITKTGGYSEEQLELIKNRYLN
jgi:hypothetical protein